MTSIHNDNTMISHRQALFLTLLLGICEASKIQGEHPHPSTDSSMSHDSGHDVIKSPTVATVDGTHDCRACAQSSVRSNCHIISGIFARDHLSVGSHIVTTIPQTACKINITGTGLGRSHLALTATSGEEILNPTAAHTSTSHFMKPGAGTVFSYYRSPSASDNDDDDDGDDNNDGNNDEVADSSLQYITADGPTDRSIVVQIVKEFEQDATEILYVYTILRSNRTIETGSRRTRHHRNPRSSAKPRKHSAKDETVDMLPTKRRSPSVDTRFNKTHTLKRLPNDGKDMHLEMTSSWGMNSTDKEFEDLLSDQPERLAALRNQSERFPELRNQSERLTEVRNQSERLIEVRNQSERLTEVRNQGSRHWNTSGYAVQPKTQLRDISGSRYLHSGPREGYDSRRALDGDHAAQSRGPVDETFRVPQDYAQSELRRFQGVGDSADADYDFESEINFQEPHSSVSSDYYRETGSLGLSSHYNNIQYHPQSSPQLQSRGYRIIYDPNAKGQAGFGINEQTAQHKRLSDQVLSHTFHRKSFRTDQPTGYGTRQQWNRKQKVHPEGYYLENPPLSSPSEGYLGETRYFHPPPPSFPEFSRDFNAEDTRYDLEAEEELARYSWKISGFTNCSRSCGGGTQSTVVVCAKLGHSPVQVTDENCERSQKLKTTNITCNTRPCPPEWDVGEWGSCSTSCDPGYKTRIVECRQQVSSLVVVNLPPARCQEDSKPETERECNTDKPCFFWKAKNWTQCSSATCGRGRRSREIVCQAADGSVAADSKCQATGKSRPKTVEECEMEPCSKSWYHTRWSQECSSVCGEGVYTRQVYCGADNKKCNEKTKPVTFKECKSEVPCGGIWFASSWSLCGVSCGEGLKRRSVICMKKLGKLTIVVNEDNCHESDRPTTEEPCQSEAPCPPLWFITDWSECSKKCDGGIQVRETKCLDDKERSSQLCDPLDKPVLKQTCNIKPCAPKSSKNSSQPFVASCRDKFKNCQMVVQARLCRFHFYKESCCFSCSSISIDNVSTPVATSTPQL